MLEGAGCPLAPFRGAEVSLVMKQDVAFNLACIGRFRADVAMLEPDAFAYDAHQVRPRGQGSHERGI